MSERWRLALLLVVVSSVPGAACGGGGGSKGAAGDRASGATATSLGAAGATTTAPGGPAPSTSARGSTPPTTGKAGASATTITTAATTAKSSGAPGPGPATPAAPGTYRYRQAGHQTAGPSSSSAPAQGTMTVDPPDAAGAQTWHRVVDPGKWSSDSKFAYASGGPFLEATTLRSSSGDVTISSTCTFSPPMPAPPWPPTVGAKFSGHADCGDFTVDVTGSVTGTQDVVIDGATRTTYVISSQLTSHGHIESTGTETDWYDPASRLPLHVDAHQQGTYGVVEFDQQLTSDLLSLKP